MDTIPARSNKTVDEVIAADKIFASIQKEHPFITSSLMPAGNVATIEFLNGKMVVHRGKELPFPVLTNNTYDESIQQTKGLTNRTFADNSIDRFAKACSMVQQFQLQDIIPLS
jgi:choloylglycine hydrolase